MVAASLASYDGSAGVLVDTNVWVDCIDTESPWHDWAVEQLQQCSERSPLHVNLIIYTELLVPGPDVALLDELLDVYEVRRSGLPWACAALAASGKLKRGDIVFHCSGASPSSDLAPAW